MRLRGVFALALALNGVVKAATADEWRSRSIYQVFTDRFALDDGSTTTPCDPVVGKYCGGSWQGVIKNLDYIQNMGFTAVGAIFTCS
jgi:alpha-amylase